MRWQLISLTPNWAAGSDETQSESRRECRDGEFVFSIRLSWQYGGWEMLLFHTSKHHIASPPSVSSLCYQTQITCYYLPSLPSRCAWRTIICFHRFVRQGRGNANNVTHLSSVGDCAFYFSHMDAIKPQKKLNLCHILSISHPGSQQLTIQSNYNE